MVVGVHSRSFLVVTLALVGVLSARKLSADLPFKNDGFPELAPYIANEEYIRKIHSMINAYRADKIGGQLVIETNALINTKYRTWKRNADLINSLLGLPKGMNDAGR